MLQKGTKSPRTCKAQAGTSNPIHQVEVIYSAPSLAFPEKINSSETCFNLFQTIFDPRKICFKEFFYVALLNNANYCIGYSIIGMGNTCGVMVNVKEIFQLAILCNASAMAIAHNHPSGELKPSANDIAITQRIKAGAELFDIKLLDHIIITHKGYFSFSDEGHL